MKKVFGLGLICAFSLASPVFAKNPQNEFFQNLRQLCGKAFAGKLVKFSDSDKAWRQSKTIMHVRDCSDKEIRIPLHVGENRSRTWIITRTAQGLRLKHDHRHEDGSPDAVTMYGGDTPNKGKATEQSFPADKESKDLFVKNNLKVSVDNTWWMMIEPEKRFSYRLTRADRDFQVDFDLSKPVPVPPPAWGSKS
ncbi:MAG: hypothetical protein ACOH5I_20125 [Oligoflexus sp.]